MAVFFEIKTTTAMMNKSTIKVASLITACWFFLNLLFLIIAIPDNMVDSWLILLACIAWSVITYAIKEAFNRLIESLNNTTEDEDYL